MHARTHTPIPPSHCSDPSSARIRVNDIRAGQHFVRHDSPSEVLSLLSFAGMECEGSSYTWAVVTDVNEDSEGYVPGQLLKLRRDLHVRRVQQVRSAHFALES